MKKKKSQYTKKKVNKGGVSFAFLLLIFCFRLGLRDGGLTQVIYSNLSQNKIKSISHLHATKLDDYLQLERWYTGAALVKHINYLSLGLVF